MKTPISYYGGKQSMLKHILPLIPPHKLYCEPFAGGAAVFFAKEPAKVEILNDLNGELVNFYRVLKTDFDALNLEVQATLHSRQLHGEAKVVYENPQMFSPVKRAWALWALSRMSFGSQLGESFRIAKRSDHTSEGRVMSSKKAAFTRELAARLSFAQIERTDAAKLIERLSANADAFIYADPPYPGADQGHYKGYTQADFEALLCALAGIKGKFLLSSYPNAALDGHAKKRGWRVMETARPLSVSGKEKKGRKTEVLTANY